jgi:hypothetical protein
MNRLIVVFSLATALAFAAPITTDYTLNMGDGGTNKTNVTSLVIFEQAGSLLHLDFIAGIPGIGTTTISHQSPFLPSLSLILGISEPSDLSGRRHIIAFVSNSFAETFSGVRFSQVFTGYRESLFGGHLLAAFAGDETERQWLRTFYTSTGYQAAFATGTVPVAGEFTPFTPIPEPATLSFAGLSLLALAAARKLRN